MDEARVHWRAFPIRGRTRISLNVHDRRGGCEYRFVPEGPNVGPREWSGVLDALQDVDADWIVASGSLPRGVPAGFYARAAAIAAERGQRFVLDTSGSALHEAVGHGLELLKLSLGELEFLLGREVRDPTKQDAEATGLVRAGAARMIAVSLGREGAILASAEGVERMTSPPVQECSAVGAGDSFLAGLVLGLARRLSHRQALALGIAAGTAAVATYGTAQVDRAAVEELYERLAA